MSSSSTSTNAPVLLASSDEALRLAIATLEPTTTVVVNVCASWAAACKDMNALFADLAEDYRNITLVQAECENVPLFLEKHKVESVPAFIFFEKGIEKCRILGANAAELAEYVASCAESARAATPDLSRYRTVAARDFNDSAAFSSTSTSTSTSPSFSTQQPIVATSVIELMSVLENATPTVCVAAGGNQDASTSEKVIDILRDANIPHQVIYLDEGGDAEMQKNMLCQLSQSNEFPQVYVSGTYVGGVAAIVELRRTGHLVPRLSALAPAKLSLAERLDALVRQENLMIFIKGTPKAPRCGYSKQLIAILNELEYEYGYFDILTDEEVRQGLKKHFDWPTYPQVYVNGELVGGIDIVREMVQSGDFQTMVMGKSEE